MTGQLLIKLGQGLLRAITLFAAYVTLSGCGSEWLPDSDYLREKINIFAVPEIPCPEVRVLRTGSRYVEYQEGSSQDIGEVEIEARISELTYTCGLMEPDGVSQTLTQVVWNIVMELDITITARRGPTAASRETVPIPFFVALLDQFGKVVEKQPFLAEVYFPKGIGSATQVHKEDIVLTIPVRDLGEADQYDTVVSFQLNQVQLDQMHK